MLNKLIKLIPVIYKDLDSSLKGQSRGFFILINKKNQDDKGVLAHERAHARQFMKFLLLAIALVVLANILGYPKLGVLGIIPIMIHPMGYSLSKWYKYKAEVEAFGYSIAYGNRTKQEVKNSLKSYYGIPDDIMKDFDKDIEKSIENAKKDLDELSN